MAGEGGASGYLQGTYNDFQAGVFGPSGLYFRNDVVRYDADAEARPLGGRVAAASDQTTWIDIAKFAWLTDKTFLGARYGAAITVPYVINADVSGTVSGGGFGVFRSSDISGLGDIIVNPALLNWSAGRHNFTFQPGIWVPTGRYDEDRLLNTGRNYWSFDLAGSYTWFDPQSLSEFSMTAGVLFNTENDDTDYTTGTEFHLDALAAKYVSPSFALGLAGYYYQQLASDDGPVDGPLTASDIQAHGFGLGPAFLYNLPVGEKTASVIGKALFDIDSDERFEGDVFLLSVAFKF